MPSIYKFTTDRQARWLELNNLPSYSDIPMWEKVQEGTYYSQTNGSWRMMQHYKSIVLAVRVISEINTRFAYMIKLQERRRDVLRKHQLDSGIIAKRDQMWADAVAKSPHQSWNSNLEWIDGKPYINGVEYWG